MTILLPLSAFVIRIIRLNYRPLWWDEGRNIFFSSLDWQSAAHVAVRSGDVNPPVYRTLLGAWMWFVGPTPFTIRLLSVFIGMVTVAMLYRFAADAFNWRIGAIAGVLSVFAPSLIYYSQEGKGYALMVLAAVCSTWAWHKMHNNVLVDRKSLWGVIGVATLIGAGAHYFYFLFMFSQGLWTVLWCWGSNDHNRIVSSFKHLAKWIAVHLVSLSPILIYGWSSVMVLLTITDGNLLGESLFAIPSLDDLARWGATTTLDSIDPYTHFLVFLSKLSHEIIVGPSATHALGLLAGLAVTIPIYMGWTRYSSKVFPRINLVLWVVIPSILSLGFSFVFSYYYSRFLIFVLPAVLLLVSVGLQSLWHKGRLLLLLSGSILLFTWTGVLSGHYEDRGDVDEDWRDLVEYFGQIHRPGDLVVHTYDWMQGYIRAYMQLDDDIDYFYLAGSNVEALESVTTERKRIWLLDYQTTPFSYGNWPGAWMRERYAMADTQMFGKASITAFVKPNDLGNVDKGVQFSNGIAMSWRATDFYVKSGDSVAIKLVFGAPNIAMEDAYQIFLHLLDSEGRLIAGNDMGPFNNLRPTASWFFGEKIDSPHGLFLPDDTVAGQYELHAGMYNQETGSRLLTSDGRDSIRLALVEVVQ